MSSKYYRYPEERGREREGEGNGILGNKPANARSRQEREAKNEFFPLPSGGYMAQLIL